MAANDRGLSKARTEVTCWNVDRRWGFRGTKGYGISHNYYHRAQRRFSPATCLRSLAARQPGLPRGRAAGKKCSWDGYSHCPRPVITYKT